MNCTYFVFYWNIWPVFQNIGPKWILFNLAGLYWRIIGNNYHGIECFRRAIYTAPDKYSDVPETNLANILYRWGRYDDALRVALYAKSLNEYEVGMITGWMSSMIY